MVKPYVDEAIQLVDSASVFADPYLQQMMGYWNYFKATEFAQSWNWATTHFYNWILGNLPPDSTYHADKHIEARYVRDGIVGQELRNYFYKIRNKNSKYCHEWESVDNYDVSFLGFDTFEGLSISKIKKHFSRTIRSFSNGLEFYLGSVQDGTAIVSPIKKENGSHYVEVEFKYINKTTSESFLYHIIEGEKKRGVMKTWTQTYI